MSRPRIYPERASLHLKVSHDVLQALTAYKLKNSVSLNRAVDDILRLALDVKANPLATTIERIEKAKKPRKKKDASSPVKELKEIIQAIENLETITEEEATAEEVGVSTDEAKTNNDKAKATTKIKLKVRRA